MTDDTQADTIEMESEDERSELASEGSEPEPVEGSESADGPTDEAVKTSGEVPSELVAAVEDNPEEVARFIQQLGAVNDLLDATSVATAAMDDEMVQRLARTGTNLGAAADGAATPEIAGLGESVGENATELTAGMETIIELQQSGTLDDLAAMADVVSLLTAAMDDEMVTSVAKTGSRLGEVADTAADDDIAAGLESMLHALGDATSDDPEPVGMIGLAKALRDPEVKAGMGVLVALLRALGAGNPNGPE
ncbi:MAG: DUF1641 domain-containing protein [Natronomonas sp.]